MNIVSLLNKMFPGECDTGMPSFSDLDLKLGQGFSLPNFNLFSPVLDSCSDETDVNDILKQLKNVNFEQAQSFISSALELYFTHPKVLAVLQQGRTSLYPHIRALDDIDYDLLAPVLEKNLGGFDE